MPPTHTLNSDLSAPPVLKWRRAHTQTETEIMIFREIKCPAQKYLSTFSRMHHSMRLSELAAVSVGLQEQILHKLQRK